MPSEFLNTTVAQAIAWILSVGISALVAYGVQWLPVDEAIKKIINAVVSVMLVAGVTALASFIPESWLALRLVDAAFALITLIIGIVGGVKFATFQVASQKAQIKTLKLTV